MRAASGNIGYPYLRTSKFGFFNPIKRFNHFGSLNSSLLTNHWSTLIRNSARLFTSRQTEQALEREGTIWNTSAEPREEEIENDDRDVDLTWRSEIYRGDSFYHEDDLDMENVKGNPGVPPPNMEDSKWYNTFLTSPVMQFLSFVGLC
eukprot:TRINITY_DN72_c0_g1_i1.p1 TRINITY_DN72_c0_g1~~TRINITY_DN72_c0_g1_i1.p1  ORF type:complete len:148 (+),score=22.00 TRINITY_DN72_c0_g1_i1:149-592(+)